ncbi:hypothetical protein Ddye_027700 [Dipteronia dyeriana]|uniref:TIR domain-containing protein n=1 Tax=Dipteronia dyeriana TaxID=168575 RepID=A0AAD9TPM3_9ROSI|nr:hypothetical protein Ddye_027700 [Dipteronia dyeriana]
MANSSTPSSSITTLPEKHEVFLSFRGEDTRYGFTSHLYDALCRKNIETSIDDDKLERGDEISSALLRAIQESKIAVVIFSENYASSKWCLRELAELIECKKMNKLIVMPVFYNVDPSDVRKQTGSFERSFANYEELGRVGLFSWFSWPLDRFKKKKIELQEEVQKMERSFDRSVQSIWMGFLFNKMIMKYEVEGLDNEETLELFRKYANPTEDCMALSKEIVKYAKGNPLALKVLGSSLMGKNKQEWESALDFYRYGRLKILDKYSLSVLIAKSLVTLAYKDSVEMHDLLKEMGREIVHKESPKILGKRSRLWEQGDVIQILKNNTGTDTVEMISLDMGGIDEDGEIVRISSLEHAPKFPKLKWLVLSHCSHLIRIPNLLDFPMPEKESGIPSKSFSIHLPGNKIPEWFSYQSLESSINIRVLRNDLVNRKFIGFEICAGLRFEKYTPYVYCDFETYHDHIKIGNSDRNYLTNRPTYVIGSEPVLLGYCSFSSFYYSFPNPKKLPISGSDYLDISIEFKCGYNGRPKRCAVHPIYVEEPSEIIGATIQEIEETSGRRSD